MAIVQISRIQHRSGNQVDLPQLAEAELGWATDTKRLFIGKTSPNENIEVMTAYSEISFSQIAGATGNLNINPLTVADGQALVYDGVNWVNRGGAAGGLITLGNVSNVSIDGGGIGYVLETDGLGNLSWTPKSTIVAYIQNVTKANPAVVTTTQDNFFTDAAEITITNAVGMTQLNGNPYYINVLTSNTFSLYTDPSLTTPVDSSAYTAYGYTTVSATTVNTNLITVAANVQSLLTVNAPIRFTGNIAANASGNLTGLLPNVTYYVKTTPSTTSMTVSNELLANGVAGNVVVLSTVTGLSSGGRSSAVYQEGGRAVSLTAGSSTSAAAGGSNSTIQYNNVNLLDGDADFTYNDSTKLLTLNGNANVGNLNATGVSTATRYISNIVSGTPPLTVTSNTQVANLNVATSGSVVNGNSNVNIPAANGNITISAIGNANIVVVTGTGVNVAGTFNTSGNANVGNIGTTTAIIATGNITTINSGLMQNSTSNIAITSGANVTLGVAGTTRITATSTGANITGTLGVSSNATVGNLDTTTATITTGNITTINSGLVQNGTSNVVVTTAGGNVTLGVAGTTRITATSTGANITGTLGVSSNATVGNLDTAQVLASANVTAPQLISNVAIGTAPLVVTSTTQVANLNVATSGTVTASAQPNITSVGTLTGLGVNGTLTAVNITANTGVFTGNGSGLSAIAGANVTGTVASATSATTAASATTAGTVTTAAQPNITSVGTLTSLTTTTITAGSSATAGTITGDWTLTTGSTLQSTYADLAEYYEGDLKYLPGTVLEFGGDKEVTLASDESTRVAGVVSTNPAYVMNATCPGMLIAIALQGRVPCKVIGKIRKGDMLVSAGFGNAKAAPIDVRLGTVIGKALQDFDGEGVIEVAVGRI